MLLLRRESCTTMPKPRPLHNITRYEYGRTRAWWVRFQVGDKSDIVGQLFSDATYGGKRKALQAAIAWRDAQAPKVYRQRKPRPYHGPGPGRIWRQTTSHTRNGWVYTYNAWHAWIRVGPRHCATKWSIDKHGSAFAKAKVEAWLKKKRAEQARFRGCPTSSKPKGGKGRT